jgi:hypothetical protein
MKNVQHELEAMHSYLMYKKFPYHSVSVIFRWQDIGLHLYIMDYVKHLVTDEIKDYIKCMGFGITYVESQTNKP